MGLGEQPLLLGDRDDKVGIVAAVVRERAVVKPDGVRADSVEEVLAVADHDEALGVARKVLLEPHALVRMRERSRLRLRLRRTRSRRGWRGKRSLRRRR